MIKEDNKNRNHSLSRNDTTNTHTVNNSDIHNYAAILQGAKYSPLRRTDFDMGIVERWCEIRTTNAPKRRSFHSAFLYDNCLYVYGGQDILQGKLNDFSRISLLADTPKWHKVKPTGIEAGKLFSYVKI
jgi:hypothetical protein